MRHWWKQAIVYQIYPSTFKDSNGDGIGDLNGICSKLDYLKELGVDVLWLSPIYKSPWKDMGYDISDYRDINPKLGTMKDFDELLKGVHDRQMKLIMDLVVNHTSDLHEWFQESRSSKSNPKRDWYIWKPAKYDSDGKRSPPNNWAANFGGSAWAWDPVTDEYYLHLFAPEQPDLNWDNPVLRDAVFEMMKFWLDKGVNGFRMDVINVISKVDGFPDAPIVYPGEFLQPGGPGYANGPHVHKYLKEMNECVLSKYDILTVGETPFSYDPSALIQYVLPENKELNMIFHFALVDMDAGLHGSLDLVPWTLPQFKKIIASWHNYMHDRGAWSSSYLENHDQPRSVSRFGSDVPEWRSLASKMLAILLVAQGGTLYVYQGQEIGMANIPKDWPIEEYKDVASVNFYKEVHERRMKEGNPDMSDVLKNIQLKARDNARTPIQWDDSPHAGFTTGAPWMRVNDDYPTWNAAAEKDDPKSVLNFWKSLFAIRKKNDSLVYGDFKLLSENDEQIFAFTRTLGNVACLAVLNFSAGNVSYEIPSSIEWPDTFKELVGNYEESGVDRVSRALPRALTLRGYEGRLYINSP